MKIDKKNTTNLIPNIIKVINKKGSFIMNEKKDLELLYILPYTVDYYRGKYRYVQDHYFKKIINHGKSLFFENEKELLEWFYKNANKPTPKVYRIKYIEKYLGIDDVFQLTNLQNGGTSYYTAFSKELYAYYRKSMSEDTGKYVWDTCRAPYLPGRDGWEFDLEDIYKEFSKRGIKIKYNVYESKEKIDRYEHFEFVGDPVWDKDEAKGKKLVLYMSNPKHWW